MRLLIIEPHARGHHASYLRWLLQACRRKGWTAVIATTPPALSHAALGEIVEEFRGVEIHLIRDFDRLYAPATGAARLLLRELDYRRSFKKAVDDVHSGNPIDAIILPYVDYCFHALGLFGVPFGTIPWCGIAMRLSITHVGPGPQARLPWKWRMVRRILRRPNARALFVINPSVKDVPNHWYSEEVYSRLRYLPDPAEMGGAESREQARAKLGLPRSAVAVLVFGSIDERKGIEALLNTLTSEPGLENYVVILAGNQSAHIRGQVHSHCYSQLRHEHRLIVQDHFLSDSEQREVFAAADVVWVGYRNHVYTSGVLVLAGRAGLPVIGTHAGEIGRSISAYGLGAAVQVDNPAEVAGALRSMFDGAARAKIGLRAQSQFADHTAANFGDIVLSAFDARTGK
jgi:glycosyltransferase involved in cell wall biosynthesis